MARTQLPHDGTAWVLLEGTRYVWHTNVRFDTWYQKGGKTKSMDQAKTRGSECVQEIDKKSWILKR